MDIEGFKQNTPFNAAINISKGGLKMKNKILLAGNILMLLLFSVSFVFATDAWVPDNTVRDKPGEIIIGFSPNATLTQRNDAIAGIGGKILGQFSAPKGRTVRIKLPFPDQAAADAAINALKTNPAIRYAEHNVIRRAFWENRSGGDFSVSCQSGDLMLQNQWSYYDIEANWVNAPSTTTGVTVAVIDTGVDYNHPDLVKKVVKGYDFVNADNDPMDDFGHGTHVAGIIAAQANNNFGIAGVSWNAKILAIKVLDSSGSGNDWDVSQGIYAAANNSSVKVINMSLGGAWSQLEQDAVDYAVNTKGKLLVAAAGNSNTSDTTNAYPAALNQVFPNKVLAVAAHDSTHCRASFSNYGTWVDITAPGVNILSTVPVSLPTELSGDGSGYNYLDGTSMASPHVAGAAALAWEKYKTYTNVQIATMNKLPRRKQRGID